MQDRQTVVLPRQSDADSALRTATLAVLKVFEFNSQHLKSGVVVTANDTAAGTGLVFVKGAHTAIQSLVLPAALPPDFDQVCFLSAGRLLILVDNPLILDVLHPC